jgi:hypothetical protein
LWTAHSSKLVKALNPAAATAGASTALTLRVFPNDIHPVVLAARVDHDVLGGGVGLEK